MSSHHTWRGDDFTSALVALVTAACPTAEVFDGPTTSQMPLTTSISIGWSTQDVALRTERGPQQGFDSHVVEVGEIECTIQCRSGDATTATARTQAAQLLAAVEAAIDADPTLGDLVDLLSLGGAIHGHPLLSDKGRGYRVDFSVRYEAML